MFWALAFLIALIAFLVYVNNNCQEHMQNKTERAKIIYTRTKPVFEGGDHSYEKFKQAVPDTDSVEYTDVRDLYKRNNFNVENIAKVI